MKRVLGLAVLVLFAGNLLAACGGGGDSTPLPTPPSDNVMGTYRLTGFTIAYSNGTTVTETSPIFTSWSGTMIIGDVFINQIFMLNGEQLPPFYGPLSIAWTDNTSGVFYVTDVYGIHNVQFWISGYDLTTYSGVVDVPGYPGLTAEEWDYWRKVSDSIATGMAGGVEERDARSAYRGKRWIGEILIPPNAD